MKQLYKTIRVGVVCAAILFSANINMFAQDFAPQKGDKLFSLKLGKAVSYGDISYYEINQSTYSSNTSIKQPYSVVDYNTNSIINAIGLEFKYFLTPSIALRFSGSGSISSSPSQDAVSGVTDPTGENIPGTTIPGYNHIEGKTTQQYFVDLGVDYYFTTKVERLFPFIGIQANSLYGQMEIFDGFRGLDSENDVIPTYDDRKGETYGLGGSLVGGIDYYISDGFCLGVELKLASYMYNGKRIYHQTGLDAQEATTNNMMFLSQPVIKLGFKF